MKLLKSIARLKGRSFRELRVRGIQFLLAREERLALALGVPSTDRVTRGPRARNLPLKGFDGTDPRDTARHLAAMDPEVFEELRRRSAAIHAGQVTLLGLKPLSVGSPPAWHRDASSGIVSPKAHWSRIAFLDVQVVGDHKVVWELNRHQYLLAPALCWLVDDDARHLELIQDHLESWLAENPPRIGVNWASSLEVSYRSITWCWLLCLLGDARWREGLRERLVSSLQSHGKHIERYLSYYFSPNTHLTGEALGLFYIGSVIPEFRSSIRWRQLGARILEDCLDRHVPADGVYFEQSTQYHRYTTEIYLHYLLMAECSGWPVSSRVRPALHRLFDVLRSLVDGAGHMPLLGDDDGGLLLPMDHRQPHDIGGLLLAGATALGRQDLRLPGIQHPSMSAWLCGMDPTRQAMDADARCPGWTDIYFAAGGLAVLRDGWQAGSAVATLDAGAHGAMNCGHAHADALSMTLSLGDTPLFVDRGTLTYVGGDRDAFRSTVSHNTLEFDSESSVTPADPFQWRGVPPRPTAKLFSSDFLTAVTSHAIGHVDSPNPSRHERTVLHARNGAWVILDRARRARSAGVACRWQLHPDLAVTEPGTPFTAVQAGDRTPVAVIAFLLADGTSVSRRDVSPCFGQRVNSFFLEARAMIDTPLLTLVIPVSGREPQARIEDLICDEGRVWTWADKVGSHSLLLRTDRALPLVWGDCRMDADLMWHTKLAPALPGGYSEVVAAVHLHGADAPEPGHVTVMARTQAGWMPIVVGQPRLGQEN